MAAAIQACRTDVRTERRAGSNGGPLAVVRPTRPYVRPTPWRHPLGVGDATTRTYIGASLHTFPVRRGGSPPPCCVAKTCQAPWSLILAPCPYGSSRSTPCPAMTQRGAGAAAPVWPGRRHLWPGRQRRMKAPTPRGRPPHPLPCGRPGVSARAGRRPNVDHGLGRKGHLAGGSVLPWSIGPPTTVIVTCGWPRWLDDGWRCEYPWAGTDVGHQRPRRLRRHDPRP